jgi:multidrug efflux pump subunit AcrA (membrane-fusion protein)
VQRKPLALIVVAVGAFALTAASCSSSTEGVTVAEVARQTVTEVVDVPASVTAKGVATLTAPADGTLRELPIAPGTSVAKGTVLAVIDSPSAQKRLADADAALRAAKSVGRGGGAIDLTALQRGLDAAAEDAFASARAAAGQVADESVRAALLAQVDASEKHYQAAATTAAALLGQVQRGISSLGSTVSALGAAQRVQAQAAYDVAKSTVDALTLRAPIDGVVQFARPASAGSTDPLAQLLGAVGGGSGGASAAAGATSDQTVAGVDDVLSPGDAVGAGAAIVTIVDISELGLAGEVDETDVLLVNPGVEGDVELDAAPGVTYGATVSSVDLLPTPSTRGGVAYRLRLTFAPAPAGSDAPPTPRPGMSAVAHLRVRTATDAVAVPAAAVFTADGGSAVWLVRDGRAVRAQVTVGVQGEELVQILSGLQPGDRIVTAGADRVSAGQRLP